MSKSGYEEQRGGEGGEEEEEGGGVGGVQLTIWGSPAALERPLGALLRWSLGGLLGAWRAAQTLSW
eukprot:2287829-Pyramimonas_sp.AAC.1